MGAAFRSGGNVLVAADDIEFEVDVVLLRQLDAAADGRAGGADGGEVGEDAGGVGALPCLVLDEQ